MSNVKHKLYIGNNRLSAVKELGQIEKKITKLENQVQELNQLLESDEVSENPEKLQTVCSEIGITENKIEQLYLRWDELEKRL